MNVPNIDPRSRCADKPQKLSEAKQALVDYLAHPIKREALIQIVDAYMEQLEYDRENVQNRLFRIEGELENCQKLYSFMEEF